VSKYTKIYGFKFTLLLLLLLLLLHWFAFFRRGALPHFTYNSPKVVLGR
jgi:hypothetical protein